MLNLALNKTFFAPQNSIEAYEFQVAIFYFAVVPLVLLVLSILTFFNSKVLMDKEGIRFRNLFISIIGLSIIAILLATAYMYIFNQTAIEIHVAYYYFLGLSLYFLWLYTANAIYASFCAVMPTLRKPDYIIVLGAALHGDQVSPVLARRLDKAAQQYNRWGKGALIITSGGQGKDELLTEAAAMKQYLIDQYKIAPEKIITETQSTSTYENMLFSKKIIDQKIVNARGIFVTNNFHVLRASMYATKVGLKAVGVGASTAFYYVPNAFTREFFGILVMTKKIHLFIVLLYTVVFFFLTMPYLFD
jgi:uncharacterized SAM-binding protein YcdF (DUF218 family)